MKRLGIFQMNDQDGLVDDYILYLLDDILPNLEEMVIVVNGALRNEEVNKLHKYTNKFYFRKNDGFDAIAYKETLIDFLGLEYIREYEEVVLFNDTFFGPFYSFKRVFDKMKNREVDFWGLTLHAEYKREGRYMPEHIQSYFLTIKRNMLISSYFEEFWNDLKSIDNFIQLVKNFETHFTSFFSSHGFKYAAYIEDNDLNGKPEYNINHYAYLPCTLMSKYDMPILKRKDFVDSKNVSLSIGNELEDAIRWIEKNTSYDTKMIWKNIIRKYNVYDLKKNLNLTYILPDFKLSDYDICGAAVILVYLTNENYLDENISYIQKCPKNMDIVVLTSKKYIYDEIQKKIIPNRIILVKNYGEEFAFIEGAKEIINKYKYLCFIHDEYTNGVIESYSKRMALNYIIWKNTLNSPGFIDNAISTLEKNKNLGILSVPEPLHSDYRKERIKTWEENYSKIQHWKKQLRINCQLDIRKRAFTFSTAFWCKTDAVKKVVEYPYENSNFENEDLRNCIKYLIIYAAQDAGYYSGVVESLDYSRIEIENQGIHIDDYMYYLEKKKRVAEFAKQFEKVYVYGAGYEAQNVKKILAEYGCPIEGYAVTDSHYRKRQLIRERISPISDVPNKENIGIIVAMNEVNTQDVKPFLQNRNRKNVFYMNE